MIVDFAAAVLIEEMIVDFAAAVLIEDDTWHSGGM
jgi:hypothetical protein